LHWLCRNKALSKVIIKLLKIQDRTQGVYVIDSDEKQSLKWTKIEDVWRHGHRLNKKMKKKLWLLLIKVQRNSMIDAGGDDRMYLLLRPGLIQQQQGYCRLSCDGEFTVKRR
jgi:hypothetical protein